MYAVRGQTIDVQTPYPIEHIYLRILLCARTFVCMLSVLQIVSGI